MRHPAPPPSPKKQRRRPAYPRVITVGIALAALACGGESVHEQKQPPVAGGVQPAWDAGSSGHAGAAGANNGGHAGQPEMSGVAPEPYDSGTAGSAGEGVDSGYAGSSGGGAPYPFDSGAADATSDAGDGGDAGPQPAGDMPGPYDDGGSCSGDAEPGL